MWFQNLTGFKEVSPEQVRSNLKFKDAVITSLVNGKSYHCGQLEIPSLSDLKENSTLFEKYKGAIKLSEVIGNVRDFHKNSENAGALFQAASQFNLLEMVGPHALPEWGVGIYENDRTQGPACAIACGAGTIYRNYFVPVNDKIGQTKFNQIDCLKEIGLALGNENKALWKMENGYALASQDGLNAINKQIHNLTESQYEELKNKLRVGIQWDSEVTISDSAHRVSQIYCSALPVAYSKQGFIYWEAFARLILEATYEATFYAALMNLERVGNDKLFLTLVGGGAFGNEGSWISDAIEKAILKFKNTSLDVCFISYGSSSDLLQSLLKRLALP